CGSGVSAAVLVAAADSGGINLALFPGSWSQWSQDLVDRAASHTGMD
ncbi:MAG: sulfurtransferase, partial [Corynebacterium variabile]|nr:sulfurtransferase [Corynebacterium variabile]